MDEAAGVVCRTRLDQVPVETKPAKILPEIKPSVEAKSNIASGKHNPVDKVLKNDNSLLKDLFGEDIQVRLIGEKVSHQGRLEVMLNNEWYLVCGDGFSMNEAQVICRQLNMGFAESVLHLKPPSISLNVSGKPSKIFSGYQCTGKELKLSECSVAKYSQICSDYRNDIAGITCVADLPDLEPDALELESSAFIEDRSIMFLQCAMEENCLSKSAYEIDKTNPGLLTEF